MNEENLEEILKDVLNIKTDLKIYVNSIQSDIEKILDDMEMLNTNDEDVRELEVLQNVKNALTNILNQDKNKNNNALEQIRKEMNSTQVKEEAAQTNVRKNR